jgi:hypothetical protein
MEVSGHRYTSVALPWGKSSQYPLDGRIGVPQNRSERYGKEKNCPPAGNRIPAVQPVAIPTEVPRLPT